MRHPLHRDRLDKRIGHHDFLMADCGGVAGVSGLDVGLEHFTDRGEAAEKLSRNLAGQRPWLVRTFAGRPVLDALRNLILEPAADAVHQRRNLDPQLGGLNRFLVKKTGQQQPQQVGGDRCDGELGRQVAAVQMVDTAHLRVGGDQVIGQLGDAVAHVRSIGKSAKMARGRESSPIQADNVL